MPKETEERNRLIVQSAEYVAKMYMYEDKILEMLGSSSGSLLEDEELINSLTESKRMS